LEIVKGKLGISRSRWEDSMAVDFREIWYDIRNRIQDRDRWGSLVKAKMKPQTT
jgi:hypothetical protein